MKLRIAENFRAVFYAPFYAIRALRLAEREGLEVEWLPSDTPGGTINEVKRGAIDAQWGGPMRVLKDHDWVPASAGTTNTGAGTRDAGAGTTNTGAGTTSGDGSSLVSFAEVVWRDPFYLVGRNRARLLQLPDVAAMRLGIVSEVPTPWYCLRADLEDAGVDTAAMRKAGRLVDNLSMTQQLEALAAGKLDAVHLFEPYASRAVAEGYAILYAAASRGPTAYTAFMTSRDTAAKRAGEFAALTRATQAALDWVAEKGGAELARLTASFFPDVPPELLRTALERYHRAGLWSRTTVLSKPGFERLAQSLQAGGLIARRAAYEECVRDFARPA